jgi:hypothetical protein
MAAPTLTLVAHQSSQVTGRFSGALADAHHEFVVAGSEAEIRRALQAGRPWNLALLDLGLATDALALVRELKTAAPRPVPVVIFAGSVSSAAESPPLAALDVAFINEHAPAAQILPALAPHLFPDSFNRRGSERVAIGLPITFRVGQTVGGAVTLDMARNGLAIRTMSPLAKNTLLQLKFTLPGNVEIEASGRVIWKDNQSGMGVEFEKMSSNAQRAIDAFMDEAVNARRFNGRATV